MLQDKREFNFHTFPDNAGEFRWHLKAGNGRIVADSGEGYTREADCISAVARFRSMIASAKLVRHPTPREKIAQELVRGSARKTLLGR